MNDILDDLAASASERVQSGYYELDQPDEKIPKTRSFVDNIRKFDRKPIIAEIKPGSPSEGKLFEEDQMPGELAHRYLDGGAVGISVLTDPDHFYGSLENLEGISGLGHPTLMKDFILDDSQIEAGYLLGASAVLLIYRLFDRGYPSFNLEGAIDCAHELGLEVLLETNDPSEYRRALETEADMIGINNRDLRSLEVDLSVTRDILGEFGKDRTTWSLSGVSKRADIDYLADAGADAYLVGTSLARAGNPEQLLQKMSGVDDD